MKLQKTFFLFILNLFVFVTFVFIDFAVVETHSQ